MVRLVFRILAYLSLAAMMVFAVLDATRSIGVSRLVLTPFAASWDAIAPGLRPAFEHWLADTVHPFLTDPVLATVLQWPTFALAGGLAIVMAIFATGGRPRRRARFARR
ncbi:MULTISPECIES: hypothetical protein [unclassified Roseitalea]|uniref:hypothetical protein n=1 Tax=unclassified Roseitalea TaxID=2639107 RepID=UPI00273DED06|nr:MULTISPECIES: hypothetical protein [unclassified Roseitalea]